MVAKKIIGRFAPSPTGPLHFGSLIAALASYLDAKSRGGQWLVRMEDLDPPREQPGADVLILKTLEALGLEWDGAVMYQSQRHEAYQDAINTLFEKKLAYYCTCSRKEIAASNDSELNNIYPGTCREQNLPRENSAIRITTNQNLIKFNDRLQGEIAHVIENDFGDFIVKRKDSLFAYHLAVVIDDAAQGITDIVRGADLLASTPQQNYLQNVLDLPMPNYCHLPVAVDASGAKLSKRSFAAPIDDNNAVPALVAALKFLNQNVPGDLIKNNKYDILGWAIKHWRLENIPVSGKIEIS